MANPNPKPGPGRPKGCGNKTPILMQELEKVIFELPKEERLERLRAYRDYAAEKMTTKDGRTLPVYKNYVNMHIQVAKRQEDTKQMDMFDASEEAALIARAEQQIRTIQERPGVTH